MIVFGAGLSDFTNKITIQHPKKEREAFHGVERRGREREKGIKEL